MNLALSTEQLRFNSLPGIMVVVRRTPGLVSELTVAFQFPAGNYGRCKVNCGYAQRLGPITRFNSLPGIMVIVSRAGGNCRCRGS